MNQDEEHLRLLSIFYYVYAGLVACAACVFGLVVVIGIAQLVNPEFLGPHHEDTEEISDLGLTLFSGALSLFFVVFAVCLINAGRCLSRRKRYTLCLVVSGFSCMFFPLGTALGVFSLIVLVRPSVKALFDGVMVPPVYPR